MVFSQLPAIIVFLDKIHKYIIFMECKCPDCNIFMTSSNPILKSYKVSVVKSKSNSLAAIVLSILTISKNN